MHQDIDARNLLIDEKENLCIFDFDFAVKIKDHYTPDRDGFKGVIFTLYEIITLDEHFREVPHAQQDAEALLNLEWVKHPDVKLDSDVQTFRDVLDAWVAERRVRQYEPADTWIHWPRMPKAPAVPVTNKNADGEIVSSDMEAVPMRTRSELKLMNEPYLEWERPASYRLRDELQKNVIRVHSAKTDSDSIQSSIAS